MKRVLVLPVLFALLSACVPVAETGPKVVLINAPADERVAGLADRLEPAILQQSALGEITFVDSNKVRFQETHRDMAGSRSPLQAAFIARAFGAEYAVTVGAPKYERSVEEGKGLFKNKRLVHIEVMLEASIIDPVSAEVLEVIQTPMYTTDRIESLEKPLVDLDEDPDLEENLERAMLFISRPLATRLAVLLAALRAA
jgi:hypothetical protein